MTEKVKELTKELEALPKDKQEEVATPLLEQLRKMIKEKPKPMKDMVGAGKGLYESMEEVDEKVNKERNSWDY
jgi:CHASE3 domain sensor protein